MDTALIIYQVNYSVLSPTLSRGTWGKDTDTVIKSGKNLKKKQKTINFLEGEGKTQTIT